MKNKPLSIITIGINATHIYETIAPLKNIDSSLFELILVVPYSLDLSDLHHFTGLPIIIARDHKLGIYHAMNIGVRSASGMYIWFLNSGDACNDICFLSSILADISSLSLFHSPDIPLIFFSSSPFLCLPSSPARRIALHFSFLCLIFPFSHQNIFIPRVDHSPFSLSFSFSSDFHLIFTLLYSQHKSFYTYRAPIASLSPGGVSDTNRFRVLLERLMIVSRGSSPVFLPLIFIAFLFRFLREILVAIVKAFLFATSNLFD